VLERNEACSWWELSAKAKDVSCCFGIDEDIDDTEHLPLVEFSIINNEPSNVNPWIVFELIRKGGFQSDNVFETEGSEKRDEVWIEVQ
jgi:hypothetical protein